LEKGMLLSPEGTIVISQISELFCQVFFWEIFY
jgi:hypothetical protein